MARLHSKPASMYGLLLRTAAVCTSHVPITGSCTADCTCGPSAASGCRAASASQPPTHVQSRTASSPTFRGEGLCQGLCLASTTHQGEQRLKGAPDSIVKGA